MNWDLTLIYKDDTHLNNSLNELSKQINNFVVKYENKLKNVNNIDEALDELDDIYNKISTANAYAYLKFAQNNQNGGFLQKISEKCTELASKIVFFELEFCSLDNAEKLASKSKYSYMLSNWLINKKYLLEKQAQSVFMKMQNNSANAFSRFFDEFLADIEFKFDNKTISEEELLSKLYNPDRKIRKKAADAFSKGLKNNIKPLLFTFNMIKNIHKTECEIKGYEHPLKARNISNEISDESVNSLIKTCENNFNLVHKFYKKKAKLLNIKQLKDYDRYAPLNLNSKNDWDFEKSCKLVRKSFNEFNPKFALIMDEALKNKAIDVYPAKQKRGGAFSYGIKPQPYVMLNHTSNRRDAFTLAHELGHLIHQKLAGDNQAFFYSDTPLTTAETASVFAEMLFFDSIKKDLNKEDKQALLASKIEDIFATLFRQINFTTFEIALHNHEGELSLEQIQTIWMQESKKMFANSVMLRDDYKYWFSYIPHFIHSPFYCYAYSYAQLLVLALFGLYKSNKCENFVQIYEKFLSLGSSKSPSDLVAMFGFNLDDESFWQLGMNEVKKLVDEFCDE